MAEKTLPKYLTISQAAEYLNTTPNTLRVWERGVRNAYDLAKPVRHRNAE